MCAHVLLSLSQRGKRRLQSHLCMELETRAQTVEDIARQVLSTGVRIQPHHYLDIIGACLYYRPGAGFSNQHTAALANWNKIHQDCCTKICYTYLQR